jgi:hypothetical protein
VRAAKYWYYGTLFVITEFLFRVTLNWSNDWQRVMDAHATAAKYFVKMEEHQP